MKVTFAQMGNYALAIKDLVTGLGCQFVEPDKTNAETVREGVKITPETICFPCKVNIGNYLSAIKKGANTILMFDSQGQCRFRYYGMIQEKILKDYGYSVNFLIFSKNNFFSQMDKMNKTSLWKKLNVLRFVYKKIKLIETTEDLAKYYRPREINNGQTDKTFKQCLSEIGEIKNNWQLEKYKSKLRTAFNQLPIDENNKPIRIGIIGEIFTVIDEFSNQQIEIVLGNMGVDVDRRLNLSQFVKHGFNPWHDRIIRQKAKGYLNYIVGGHGLESVVEMLDYAKKKYDGVIHLWPMGCMPEVTVRPVLDKIKQDKDIALLGLSIDEQSGQAGLQTRLEAFVDLLKSRRQKKYELLSRY